MMLAAPTASGGKLLGVDAFSLQIAIGALIVIAVWIDNLRKGKLLE